ncbi:hypothetical protein LCGC14_2915950, partial [marine sediment metagenome]
KLPPGGFQEAYARRLVRAGVPLLMDRFAALSERHDGRPLVLLCYEDLSKAPCHRRVFAAFWEEKTGQAVPELAAQEMLDV